ncbi:membrane protein [Nesterenkonia sp. AN1]|uniref:Putative superfamily III holin-X n=2 Tax=Nesterenkonia aurantiaca TaxID=1436010 RepID=A0A4R7FY42_9MICC|nr:phage holin family protein [Nesterenkonia sp. AN1]EXF26212.1 membrane protein [Nesterenkonia sp. AN1]TDS83720.1 putative superfamily III holin-X [Nesterenkonia aurantiaca]
MSHPAKPSEPTVPELMTRLSEQTSRLVRDEVRLAQAELTAKARQGGIGAGFLGVGGILAWFGVGALITTSILGLALILPAWAAALIVTAVLFIAAAITALLGKKRLEELSPAPERTITNVKLDVAEVKEHTRHDTR